MTKLTKQAFINNIADTLLFVGAGTKFGPETGVVFDKKRELKRNLTETDVVSAASSLLDFIWDEFEYLDGRTKSENKDIWKFMRDLEKLQNKSDNLFRKFLKGDRKGLCRGENVF
jgi:hypothetical protein